MVYGRARSFFVTVFRRPLRAVVIFVVACVGACTVVSRPASAARVTRRTEVERRARVENALPDFDLHS